MFYGWPSLISEWIDLSNLVSPFHLRIRSNRYLVWKKMILFEEMQTGFMVAQHTDSASCESTIPSIMPYKPSQCALQICRWFLEFLTVQNNNLTTISLSNKYMAKPFYTYWFYTTRQHTKTLICGEIIFQYLLYGQTQYFFKMNCLVLSQQLNYFRLKFCNFCLWIRNLSSWVITSSYAVLMIQATLPLRHYTAHLLHWPC